MGARERIAPRQAKLKTGPPRSLYSVLVFFWFSVGSEPSPEVFNRGDLRLCRGVDIVKIDKNPTDLTKTPHTNNRFFKLVEVLLQIHSSFFSHSINLRAFPLLAVTVSLNYLPRCLRSKVTCGKTPTSYQRCQVQVNKNCKTTCKKMPHRFKKSQTS